jgi:hypothetical protein
MGRFRVIEEVVVAPRYRACAACSPITEANDDYAQGSFCEGPAQPVSDDVARLELETGEQVPEEAFSRGRVPPVLHQNIEHDVMLVHRAPTLRIFAQKVKSYLNGL